jgi:hypothetical protein
MQQHTTNPSVAAGTAGAPSARSTTTQQATNTANTSSPTYKTNTNINTGIITGIHSTSSPHATSTSTIFNQSSRRTSFSYSSITPLINHKRV